MLLGLEDPGSHVMPYLVHRLIRSNEGLIVDSDCITWPFWVPVRNKCSSLITGSYPSYESLMPGAMRVSHSLRPEVLDSALA